MLANIKKIAMENSDEKKYLKILKFEQENCTEIITMTDIPFRRLDHYKIHEYTKKWYNAQKEPISMIMTTSIDAMFKRKRGRPPKNRVIEVSPSFFAKSLSISPPST